MPAGPPDHERSGCPTDACVHPASVSPPAAPAAGDTPAPSGPRRGSRGMPRRRGVPHLRWRRRRRLRVLDWLALLPRPATGHRAGQCGRAGGGTDGSDSSWPQGTVGAGGLVTFLVGVVGSDEHAPSRHSPLDLVEAGDLPSDAVLLSAPSPVLCPPPTAHTAPAWISHQRAYTTPSAGCGPAPPRAL